MENSIYQENKVEMIVKDGVLKVSDLPKVIEEFQKPISEEGIQESKASVTQKGYDTIGYGYAWISERLNKVVGFCWRILEQNESIKEVKSNTGKSMYEVSVDVLIQLGNWKNKEIEEEERIEKLDLELKNTLIKKNFHIIREFEVLAESPIGNGWHKAFSLADAKKGAKTNGFKKAAGFFGIGNEAYKKSIDEENQGVKDALAKKRRKSGNKTFAPTTPVSIESGKADLGLINQKLEALGAKTEEEKLTILRDKFKFTAMRMDNLNEKQIKMILARILQVQY